MKIWKKILLGFIAVIIIMILVEVNALRNNIQLINQVDELELSNRIELTQSNRIAYYTQRVKSNIRELFLETEQNEYPHEIEKAKRFISDGMVQVESSIKALKAATTIGSELKEDEEEEEEEEGSEVSELVIIDSVEILFKSLTKDVNEVLRLQKSMNSDGAKDLFETNVEPVSAKIQELVFVLIKDSELEVEEVIAHMNSSVDKAILLGIYLTVLSVLLSLGIGLLIARSISKPLNKLIESAIQIGKGNFESKVKIKTGDELETLGGSFNGMADQLKFKISSIDELNKSLLESNNAKDTLFSIIAHDIKNPFSIIMGYADLLATEYDDFDEKKRRKFIDEINKSSKITFKLLENLLTWARSQSGKIEINKEKINLLDLVNSSIETYAANADFKNIGIENNVLTGLDVMADKFTLTVVINNLISNAIKFTDIGGQISIDAKQTENEVELSVKDTGIGIGDEMQKSLFMLRGSSSRKGTVNESGTGLGLVLAKDFIDKNGGKIWVKSNLGVGSLFSFSIPV